MESTFVLRREDGSLRSGPAGEHGTKARARSKALTSEASLGSDQDSGFGGPRADARLRQDHAAVLAALYLRGAPRGLLPRPTGFREVLRALASACCALEAAENCLRAAGMREEAAALAEPGLLAWAERLVHRGGVLTACCEGYPAVWRRRLGGRAPAALWMRGAVPQASFVVIVGCRSPSNTAWEFARSCAGEALRTGFAVASGGAYGCDSAAALGALEACGYRGMRGCLRRGWALPAEEGSLESRAALGEVPLLEILPVGLENRSVRRPGCALSVCAPQAGFSSAQAMERNLLLYALAELAVVCQARFKEGGSWRGASEALRRRLCPVAVRQDPDDRAARALAALGAHSLEAPGGLADAVLHGAAREPGERLFKS